MPLVAETAPRERFWTPLRWQTAGRLAFLLLLALATSLLYRVVRPQWVAYREAENALAAGDNDRALREYRTALAAGASTRQLPLHVAEALDRLRRPREAIPYLEPLRRRFPPDEGATRLLAGIYDAAGRPADALHVYFDGLETGVPRSPDILVHQADLFRRLQRSADAERLYLEVLAGDSPARSRAALHLAELYLWTRRPARALARFDEALRLDPASRDARIGRARALAAAGRRAESIAAYRSLLPP